MDEFQMIERFFRRQVTPDFVKVGIGDDGAVLTPRKGCDLVVTTDSLVEGVHFLPNVEPADLGYKALAVNLSDLAAMGATPNWATLNLVLPTVDLAWLEEFSKGVFLIADQFGISLVGGDTSYGPLSLGFTVGGWVPSGEALRRDGARSGDYIYVSGSLGDAALALQLETTPNNEQKHPGNKLLERLQRPIPRVGLGQALRNMASAAIDLSDGLAADLSHVVVASGGLGALIEGNRLPFSTEALSFRSRQQLIPFALGGGDDYELCFCVPPERKNEIDDIRKNLDISLTMIGRIDSQPGIWLEDESGTRAKYRSGGYLHQWSQKNGAEANLNVCGKGSNNE